MKKMQLLLWLAFLLPVLFIGSCRKDEKEIAREDRPTVAQQDRTFIVIAEEGKKLEPITESLAGLHTTKYHLKKTVPELGLIQVQTPDPGFPAKARQIAGVQAVVIDVSTNWEVPVKAVRASRQSVFSNTDPAAKAVPVYSGDPYGVLQWDMQSIKAPAAWAKGFKGNGVKVAILDAGFKTRDPEIIGKIINTQSFIPDEPVEAFEPIGQREYFSQGTCAAGIVAASHDGHGVVGIAPGAQLILVKVISDFTHEAPWSSLIDGIFYAVNHGAKVIEMNVAGKLPRKSYIDNNGTPNYPNDDYEVEYTRDIRDLVIALNRATVYANLSGATLVAPSGDNKYNFDVEKNFVVYPAAALGVLCIGSNGPVGWGINEDTTLYKPATYMNYGRSYIRFGAPGGNSAEPFDALLVGEVAGFGNWEYLFNWVYNIGFWIPDEGGYYPSWAVGSALAAAHAAGSIALLYENHPWMNAVLVDAVLRKSADDYGAPGKDPYFGYGQINAGKAVSLVK